MSNTLSTKGPPLDLITRPSTPDYSTTGIGDSAGGIVSPFQNNPGIYSGGSYYDGNYFGAYPYQEHPAPPDEEGSDNIDCTAYLYGESPERSPFDRGPQTIHIGSTLERVRESARNVYQAVKNTCRSIKKVFFPSQSLLAGAGLMMFLPNRLLFGLKTFTFGLEYFQTRVREFAAETDGGRPIKRPASWWRSEIYKSVEQASKILSLPPEKEFGILYRVKRTLDAEDDRSLTPLRNKPRRYAGQWLIGVLTKQEKAGLPLGKLIPFIYGWEGKKWQGLVNETYGNPDGLQEFVRKRFSKSMERVLRDLMIQFVDKWNAYQSAYAAEAQFRKYARDANWKIVAKMFSKGYKVKDLLPVLPPIRSMIEGYVDKWAGNFPAAIRQVMVEGALSHLSTWSTDTKNKLDAARHHISEIIRLRSPKLKDTLDSFNVDIESIMPAAMELFKAAVGCKPEELQDKIDEWEARHLLSLPGPSSSYPETILSRMKYGQKLADVLDVLNRKNSDIKNKVYKFLGDTVDENGRWLVLPRGQLENTVGMLYYFLCGAVGSTSSLDEPKRVEGSVEVRIRRHDYGWFTVRISPDAVEISFDGYNFKKKDDVEGFVRSVMDVISPSADVVVADTRFRYNTSGGKIESSSSLANKPAHTPAAEKQKERITPAKSPKPRSPVYLNDVPGTVGDISKVTNDLYDKYGEENWKDIEIRLGVLRVDKSIPIVVQEMKLFLLSFEDRLPKKLVIRCGDQAYTVVSDGKIEGISNRPAPYGGGLFMAYFGWLDIKRGFGALIEGIRNLMRPLRTHLDEIEPLQFEIPPDGKIFSFGRPGTDEKAPDFPIPGSPANVSRRHVIVERVGEQMWYIKDNSRYPTTYIEVEELDRIPFRWWLNRENGTIVSPGRYKIEIYCKEPNKKAVAEEESNVLKEAVPARPVKLVSFIIDIPKDNPERELIEGDVKAGMVPVDPPKSGDTGKNGPGSIEQAVDTLKQILGNIDALLGIGEKDQARKWAEAFIEMASQAISERDYEFIEALSRYLTSGSTEETKKSFVTVTQKIYQLTGDSVYLSLEGTRDDLKVTAINIDGKILDATGPEKPGEKAAASGEGDKKTIHSQTEEAHRMGRGELISKDSLGQEQRVTAHTPPPKKGEKAKTIPPGQAALMIKGVLERLRAITSYEDSMALKIEKTVSKKVVDRIANDIGKTIDKLVRSGYKGQLVAALNKEYGTYLGKKRLENRMKNVSYRTRWDIKFRWDRYDPVVLNDIKVFLKSEARRKQMRVRAKQKYYDEIKKYIKQLHNERERDRITASILSRLLGGTEKDTRPYTYLDSRHRLKGNGDITKADLDRLLKDSPDKKSVALGAVLLASPAIDYKIFAKGRSSFTKALAYIAQLKYSAGKLDEAAELRALANACVAEILDRLFDLKNDELDAPHLLGLAYLAGKAVGPHASKLVANALNISIKKITEENSLTIEQVKESARRFEEQYENQKAQIDREIESYHKKIGILSLLELDVWLEDGQKVLESIFSSTPAKDRLKDITGLVTGDLIEYLKEGDKELLHHLYNYYLGQHNAFQQFPAEETAKGLDAFINAVDRNPWLRKGLKKVDKSFHHKLIAIKPPIQRFFQGDLPVTNLFTTTSRKIASEAKDEEELKLDDRFGKESGGVGKDHPIKWGKGALTFEDVGAAAGKASSFDELAGIAERLEDNYFIHGRLHIPKAVAAKLIREIYKVNFEEEIWKYNDIPTVLQDGILNVALSYQGRLKVILGEKYEPIFPTQYFDDWDSHNQFFIKESEQKRKYHNAVWNLALYSRIKSDPGLGQIEKDYRAAAAKNSARLRKLIGDISNDIKSPEMVADLLVLFSRHAPRGTSAKGLKPVFDLKEKATKDAIISMASHFPDPLEAVRFFSGERFDSKSVGYLISNLPKVAAPFRVRNLRRLKPAATVPLKFLYIKTGEADLSGLLNLMSAWREKYPDKKLHELITPIVLTADPDIWDHLINNDVYLKDADETTVKLELKNRFPHIEEGELSKFFESIKKNKLEFLHNVLKWSGRPSNLSWEDLKMILERGYKWSRFKYISDAFLGAITERDLLTAFKNQIKFVDRIGGMPRGVKLNEHTDILITKDMYESNYGITFALYYKDEHLGTVGFNILDDSIDIVQLQGGRNQIEGEVFYDEFLEFSGGLAPLPWLATVAANVLLNTGKAAGRQIRSIGGEYIKGAYPHSGLYEPVKNQDQALSYWDRPALFTAEHEMRQIKEKAHIHEDVYNNLGIFDKMAEMGSHTVDLYNKTAQQLGFRRKKNHKFWVWSSDKSDDEIGKPFFSSKDYNQDKLKGTVDNAVTLLNKKLSKSTEAISKPNKPNNPEHSGKAGWVKSGMMPVGFWKKNLNNAELEIYENEIALHLDKLVPELREFLMEKFEKLSFSENAFFEQGRKWWNMVRTASDTIIAIEQTFSLTKQDKEYLTYDALYDLKKRSNNSEELHKNLGKLWRTPRLPQELWKAGYKRCRYGGGVLTFNQAVALIHGVFVGKDGDWIGKTFRRQVWREGWPEIPKDTAEEMVIALAKDIEYLSSLNEAMGTLWDMVLGWYEERGYEQTVFHSGTAKNNSNGPNHDNDSGEIISFWEEKGLAPPHDPAKWEEKVVNADSPNVAAWLSERLKKPEHYKEIGLRPPAKKLADPYRKLRQQTAAIGSDLFRIKKERLSERIGPEAVKVFELWERHKPKLLKASLPYLGIGEPGPKITPPSIVSSGQWMNILKDFEIKLHYVWNKYAGYRTYSTPWVTRRLAQLHWPAVVMMLDLTRREESDEHLFSVAKAFGIYDFLDDKRIRIETLRPILMGSMGKEVKQVFGENGVADAKAVAGQFLDLLTQWQNKNRLSFADLTAPLPQIIDTFQEWSTAWAIITYEDLQKGISTKKIKKAFKNNQGFSWIGDDLKFRIVRESDRLGKDSGMVPVWFEDTKTKAADGEPEVPIEYFDVWKIIFEQYAKSQGYRFGYKLGKLTGDDIQALFFNRPALISPEDAAYILKALRAGGDLDPHIKSYLDTIQEKIPDILQVEAGVLADQPSRLKLAAEVLEAIMDRGGWVDSMPNEFWAALRSALLEYRSASPLGQVVYLSNDNIIAELEHSGLYVEANLPIHMAKDAEGYIRFLVRVSGWLISKFKISIPLPDKDLEEVMKNIFFRSDIEMVDTLTMDEMFESLDQDLCPDDVTKRSGLFYRWKMTGRFLEIMRETFPKSLFLMPPSEWQSHRKDFLSLQRHEQIQLFLAFWDRDVAGERMSPQEKVNWVRGKYKEIFEKDKVPFDYGYYENPLYPGDYIPIERGEIKETTKVKPDTRLDDMIKVYTDIHGKIYWSDKATEIARQKWDKLPDLLKGYLYKLIQAEDFYEYPHIGMPLSSKRLCLAFLKQLGIIPEERWVRTALLDLRTAGQLEHDHYKYMSSIAKELTALVLHYIEVDLADTQNHLEWRIPAILLPLLLDIASQDISLTIYLLRRFNILEYETPEDTERNPSGGKGSPPNSTPPAPGTPPKSTPTPGTLSPVGGSSKAATEGGHYKPDSASAELRRGGPLWPPKNAASAYDPFGGKGLSEIANEKFINEMKNKAWPLSDQKKNWPSRPSLFGNSALSNDSANDSGKAFQSKTPTLEAAGRNNDYWAELNKKLKRKALGRLDDEIQKGWSGFMLFAEHNGITAEHLRCFFIDAMVAVSYFDPVVKNWFSDLPYAAKNFTAEDWDFIRNYSPAANPHKNPIAKDLVAWLQNKIFPPDRSEAALKFKYDISNAIQVMSPDIVVDVIRKLHFLLPYEFKNLFKTLIQARDEAQAAYKLFSGGSSDDESPARPSRILKHWGELGLFDKDWKKSRMDQAWTRIGMWVNGEEEGVEPYLARDLVRRSIEDTLALRSLLILASDPEIAKEHIEQVLSLAGELIGLGNIKGDVIGLTLGTVIDTGHGHEQAAMAEIISSKKLLKEGYEVEIIPSDKPSRKLIPDFFVRRKGSQPMLVEVKSVLAETKKGYLKVVIKRLSDAEQQLASYAGTYENIRRVVHIYIVGPDVNTITPTAKERVEDELNSGGLPRIDEVHLIPLDSSGGKWETGKEVIVKPRTINLPSAGSKIRVKGPTGRNGVVKNPKGRNGGVKSPKDPGKGRGKIKKAKGQETGGGVKAGEIDIPRGIQLLMKTLEISRGVFVMAYNNLEDWDLVKAFIAGQAGLLLNLSGPIQRSAIQAGTGYADKVVSESEKELMALKKRAEDVLKVLIEDPEITSMKDNDIYKEIRSFVFESSGATGKPLDDLAAEARAHLKSGEKIAGHRLEVKAMMSIPGGNLARQLQQCFNGLHGVIPGMSAEEAAIKIVHIIRAINNPDYSCYSLDDFLETLNYQMGGKRLDKLEGSLENAAALIGRMLKRREIGTIKERLEKAGIEKGIKYILIHPDVEDGSDDDVDDDLIIGIELKEYEVPEAKAEVKEEKSDWRTIVITGSGIIRDVKEGLLVRTGIMSRFKNLYTSKSFKNLPEKDQESIRHLRNVLYNLGKSHKDDLPPAFTSLVRVILRGNIKIWKELGNHLAGIEYKVPFKPATLSNLETIAAEIEKAYPEALKAGRQRLIDEWRRQIE